LRIGQNHLFTSVSMLSCEGLSLRLEKKQIRIVAVEVCDARNGDMHSTADNKI